MKWRWQYKTTIWSSRKQWLWPTNGNLTRRQQNVPSGVGLGRTCLPRGQCACVQLTTFWVKPEMPWVLRGLSWIYGYKMQVSDVYSTLKRFDAYPKTLEDFRVKTFGGAAGKVDFVVVIAGSCSNIAPILGASEILTPPKDTWVPIFNFRKFECFRSMRSGS